MAIHGFTPTLNEFSDLIKSRKFPYGFRKTSAEEPFQAFPNGKTVNINSSGWKLAHLYSVNQNDYNFDYKKQCKKLFPVGNQNDWKYQEGNNFPSRYIDEKNTEELRKITIAHFLRLVHPINYFLVPKRNLSNVDIGESKKIIGYIRHMTLNRYKNLFINFEELIMAKKIDLYQDEEIENQIQYGQDFKIKIIKKENVKEGIDKTTLKVSTIKSTTNTNIDLSVLKAYLIDGLSFRSIEKKILKIDSKDRGGGFVAKEIVNSYGFTVQNKQTISFENISSQIEENSGKLRNSLILLKEFLEINK